MDVVPVEVAGISVYSPYQGYVVILEERDGNRMIPIFIGAHEAHTILLLRQGMQYVRPLTYDLFQSLLEVSDAHVENVTITDLKDNTFFAEVTLKVGSGKSRGVDARPSDAIALAIKTSAPIFVGVHVLEKAGIVGGINSVGVDVKEKLRDLKQQLDVAVDQEAYEEAARIRDKILELVKKDPGGDLF